MSSNFKTFFLFSFLTVLLVVAGHFPGGIQGAVTAFILTLIMNVVSFWFSDKIVLKGFGIWDLRFAICDVRFVICDFVLVHRSV